jgi:non-ribosomal peptide synthetase component F
MFRHRVHHCVSLGAIRQKLNPTDEGYAVFADLLRTALWEVVPGDSAPFRAAVCFLTELTRTEVTAALQDRIMQLENQLRRIELDEKEVAAARLWGELEFTDALLDRVRTGSYTFAGEPE